MPCTNVLSSAFDRRCTHKDDPKWCGRLHGFTKKGETERLRKPVLQKRPGWFIDKVSSEVIGCSKSKQEFPCVHVSIEPCGRTHFLSNHKSCNNCKKPPKKRPQICANSGLPVLLEAGLPVLLEAVLLFQEMPKNGLRPLSATFNLFGICV